MKGLKRFCNPALALFFIIIALVFNGCSNNFTLFDNDEKSEKALNIYVEAVDKLKNEKNFDLKLTTSVQLKEIDCSVSIFNSILKKVFDHRISNLENDIAEFSFVDGVLTDDTTIVPGNIVQPVNSEINKDLYDGVTSSYIYTEDGIDMIYFVIGEETASINDVMNVFEQLKDEVGSDFGNYDIHNGYPEIDALAEYHSNFIDIMSVAPRVKGLMDMNNNQEHSEDDSSYDYGEFGRTTEIENGICSLGNTCVTAQLDKDDRLETVVFDVPVNIDVNINLMHKQFKAVVCFEVSQTYEYSYFE